MAKINGTDHANTLNGTAADDRIYGLGGNDTLYGLAGDDLIDGGRGADAMYGGTGDDTFYVNDTLDRVYESKNEGFDTVFSTVNFHLGAYVEKLVLAGTGSTSGYGNSGNNIIVGNASRNVIDGGAGADTMSGAGGRDDYYVDNTLDKVIELAGEGSDTVHSTVNFHLGDNVENLILTGTGSTSGYGNAQNNVITGNDSRNVINGGAGTDTMSGGGGRDDYYVDDTRDKVVEQAGGGSDTVHSSVSFTLGANVENLILTGSGNLTGTGNAGNNRITGNDGANVLDGGTGADTLNGAGGDDTLIVRSFDSDKTIDGGTGFDTLAFSTDGTATQSSLTFAIQGAKAVLYVDNPDGSFVTLNIAGLEQVDGYATAGPASSGGAIDLRLAPRFRDGLYIDANGQRVIFADNTRDFVLQNTSDADFSNLSHGVTMQDGLPGEPDAQDFIVNGEIVGTGYYAVDRIDGTAFADTLNTSLGELSGTLYGLGGNDRLEGGSRTNYLHGGDGNDLLVGEFSRGGLYGDAGNDTIVFDGVREGSLEIDGGADSDELVVDENGSGSIVDLSNGRITSEREPDYSVAVTGIENVTGSVGGETLIGNGVANVLDGGDGSDTLTGNGGADVFKFSTTLGSENVDQVTDFISGIDRFGLSHDIFGLAAGTQLAAGAFYVGTAAHDADDRIIYDASSGLLFYDADGSGNIAAVAFAKLGTGTLVRSTDFYGA